MHYNPTFNLSMALPLLANVNVFKISTTSKKRGQYTRDALLNLPLQKIIVSLACINISGIIFSCIDIRDLIDKLEWKASNEEIFPFDLTIDHRVLKLTDTGVI